MTPQQIDIAISDRFRRWGRFLRQEGATPMVVLSLRARDRELVITTVEEMPDELIRDALIAAAAAISEGKVDPR
jgi:hypothetical protein